MTVFLCCLTLELLVFLSGFMSAIMFDPILVSEHKLSRCLIEMVIPTLVDDGSEICP